MKLIPELERVRAALADLSNAVDEARDWSVDTSKGFGRDSLRGYALLCDLDVEIDHMLKRFDSVFDTSTSQ